jgi:tetratricopeptide (TPR) repeat protein
MRRAAFILFAAAVPALAADQWVRVTAPEFELFTSAGEKKGKDTIRHFEQVREFFLKASPVRGPIDFPVQIVEFGSDEQYQPFRPDTGTAAYFFGTPGRDYIVLGPQASGNYPVSIHEYMHLIIRHSGLRIPVWLNEGWADVYSTLRPMGKETAVGDLIDDRMQILTRAKWLDFNELTSTTRDSPNYHEASRIGIFYAESWALTHMLYLSPEYKDNFGKFVMALHRGSSAAEACRIAFDRTPDEVFRDLQAYFDRKKIYGRVFEAGLGNHEAEPAATAMTGFDSRLMLANLMFASRKVAEANLVYAGLEMEQPDRPELARAIGSAALATRDVEKARRYFEKAFAEGDADAEMCLQLALLEGFAKQRPEKIIPILERALKSKPDFAEAKIRLGLAMIDARDFAAGISRLMAISNVTPDHAPAVFCGLSYAYIETGDTAAARQNAETCRKWAKTDPDLSRADLLLKLADARSQPAAAVHPGEIVRRIAGIARNLECSPEGNRLQIVAGNRLITFDIPVPEAVETIQQPPGFTLACGALKQIPIAVEYAPPRSAMEISAGIVRRLVFSLN